MINGKYLSEALPLDDEENRDKFETGVINLINEDCGCGKTYYAFNELPKLASSPERVLFLIDSCAGRDQNLMNKNAKNYDSFCEKFANGELVNFEEKKIVVMTYAKAGAILFFNKKFLTNFDVIICDEFHKLIEFIEWDRSAAKKRFLKEEGISEKTLKGFSKDKQQRFWNKVDADLTAHSKTYRILSELQLFALELDCPEINEDTERIVCGSATNNPRYVIAMTATPPKTFYNLMTEIQKIEVAEQLRRYENLIEQDYKNLSELIRQLKKNSKGVIYMTRISEIEKYLPQVEERGFNCGAIWSIHNEEHPMTEEQRELRDYIIKNQLIPDGIDVLFYNASYETAINIDTPVDWAIIHSSNSDKIKQALNRIRNDRPIVYTYNPNKEDEQYTVPVEWLDKPLTKEMKKELCSIMAIKDSRRVVTGWTTLKRTLIENGYKIQDKIKTRNGKRESVSIISE